MKQHKPDIKNYKENERARRKGKRQGEWKETERKKTQL